MLQKLFFFQVCCQNLTKLTGLTFLLMCIMNIYEMLRKTFVTAVIGFSVSFSSCLSTAVTIHEITSGFPFVHWLARTRSTYLTTNMSVVAHYTQAYQLILKCS